MPKNKIPNSHELYTVTLLETMFDFDIFMCNFYTSVYDIYIVYGRVYCNSEGPLVGHLVSAVENMAEPKLNDLKLIYIKTLEYYQTMAFNDYTSYFKISYHTRRVLSCAMSTHNNTT